jgi:hypothetical protein
LEIDPLNEKQLRDIIDSLIALESMGFKSSFSPVSVLLDAMIDCCLLIRKQLETASPDLVPNKSLKEVEYLEQWDKRADPAVMTKMVSIRTKDTRQWYSPQIAKIFGNLATSLAKLRNVPSSSVSSDIVLDIMRLEENLTLQAEQSIEQNLAFYERRDKLQKLDALRKKREKKRARAAYHRRRKRKP